MTDRGKREAWARAAATGEPSTRALCQVATPSAPARPAVFNAPQGIQLRSPGALIADPGAAEAYLDDANPYARTPAFDARAHLYHQLYAPTTDPVYAAACLRAALLDEATTARIRFAHHIPTTLRPRAQTTLIDLRTCA